MTTTIYGTGGRLDGRKLGSQGCPECETRYGGWTPCHGTTYWVNTKGQWSIHCKTEVQKRKTSRNIVITYDLYRTLSKIRGVLVRVKSTLRSYSLNSQKDFVLFTSDLKKLLVTKRLFRMTNKEVDMT